MTEDAQAEAERIVGRRLRSTVAGETREETKARQDEVVAALAAAIEADGAESQWALEAALDVLRDALSALRVGEET